MMGVRGLKTYIRNRKDTFLHNYNLCDTKLIIDGPNLIYCLYEFFKISIKFGGDYDRFAGELENFFLKLRRFRIQPIVIFDGADDPTDIKLKTHMQRMEKRSRDVQRIFQPSELALDDDNISVLPLLTEITFKQVLVKLGVEHACSLFEADWQIASLANRFNCPVLSSDSDFYVFELDVGCIDISDLFDSFKNSPCLEYLPTKIYNYRLLIEKLKMGADEYVLPVFATLVGNDYFDSSKCQFKNPKNAFDKLAKFAYKYQFSKNLTKKGKQYLDFSSVYMQQSRDNVQLTINWICRAEFSCGKEAFENIAEQLSGEQKSLFTKSVLSYFNVKSDENPGDVHDLIGEIQRTELARNSDSVPDLPEWFIQSLIKCENNCNFLLNIVINKRLIFKSQIENQKRPPSFACSKGIRRVIYGILIGKIPKKQIKLREYHRVRNNRSNVLPIRRLQDFPELPHIADVDKLEPCSRKALLYAIFGGMVKPIPEEMEDTSKVLILMLSLWKRNSGASQVQLKTFIKCLLTMLICNSDGLSSYREILEVRDNMSKRSLDQFKSKMKKLMKRCIYFSKVDIDILHKNAQFQSIYREMLFLNQLLLQPVFIPDPRNLINGTLVCNLQAQNELSETLLGGRASPLFTLFKTWLDTINQSCKRCTRDKCPIASSTVTTKVNPRNKYERIKVFINNAE